MSSDFQKVGNGKPEAVALGVVRSIQQSGAAVTFCWFASCSGGMLTQLLSKKVEVMYRCLRGND